MGELRICSRCKHWVRGFEGMKRPERAASGGCYLDGNHDVMDFEVTRYSDTCDGFEARLVPPPIPEAHTWRFSDPAFTQSFA